MGINKATVMPNKSFLHLDQVQVSGGCDTCVMLNAVSDDAQVFYETQPAG